MKWDTLEEEPCSLARTIGVIGDRWTLLILRECFLRTRRFEVFQSALGITRHLLAERLKKLVRMGVLRRILIDVCRAWNVNHRGATGDLRHGRAGRQRLPDF